MDQSPQVAAYQDNPLRRDKKRGQASFLGALMVARVSLRSILSPVRQREERGTFGTSRRVAGRLVPRLPSPHRLIAPHTAIDPAHVDLQPLLPFIRLLGSTSIFVCRTSLTAA